MATATRFRANIRCTVAPLLNRGSPAESCRSGSIDDRPLALEGIEPHRLAQRQTEVAWNHWRGPVVGGMCARSDPHADTASMNQSTPAAPIPASAKPTTFTFQSSNDPLLRAQPHRMTTAVIAHADQKPRERVLLYALVFALAPKRCLEIGVRWGGGSRIIHAALSDLAHGVLVSIDPSPTLEFDWTLIADRATLIIGSSPADLGRCRAAVDGAFDFVFVDGDHSETSCYADLEGVAEITSTGANILLHDAFHPPVDRAITRALQSLPYADVAMPALTRNDGLHVESGRTMTFGGVRWLRRA